MMTDRIQTFIDTLSPSLPEYLEKIRREAEGSDVPVIRRASEPLIRFLLKAHTPMRLLEVGTAVGYSALFMSHYGPEGMHIDTIERSDLYAPKALSNIEAAGRSDLITLHKGEAVEILSRLQPFYDMIFMDAAKGQYGEFLPRVTQLLKKGGILLSDNVFYDGDIIKPRAMITRRDRTIHKRMREYLHTITHSPDYETVILQVADGMSVSVKK